MARFMPPVLKLLTVFFVATQIAACTTPAGEAPAGLTPMSNTQDYIIGPGDTLEIFVWRNADLSRVVPVRPDGRVSIPLIDDLQAAGKTATQVGNEIETLLAEYVQQPRVTVIVQQFVGPFGAQIRFVGDGVVAQAIPYRENMTILDAVITIGGLKEFASGNNARISRRNGNETNEFRVRLDDLLNDGDLDANIALQPGDIIIVPESWF